MLKYVIFCFFISFSICLFIIKISQKIDKLITDSIHNGVQKFHKTPTPRIGGLAVFIAFALAVPVTFLKGETYRFIYMAVFLASIPAFLAGFLEDLTGRLSQKIRLFIILISGSLAFLLGDINVVRVDIPYIDELFKFEIFSFIFTVFAITGLTNAINIIDGFNGLTSMVSIMILLCISFVAYKLGNYFIATASLAMVGAIAGFFVLNYPYGLIFLGDGGAYFTGFFIATMSILLVKKHPEVSAWFAVLVNIYPIYEVLFSIYRRKILKKGSAMRADTLHLHTLFYKVVVKTLLGIRNPIYRNPATSPLIWMINLLGVFPAVLFWNSTSLCIAFSLAFAMIYTVIYWSIIYKKLPLKI